MCNHPIGGMGMGGRYGWMIVEVQNDYCRNGALAIERGGHT